MRFSKSVYDSWIAGSWSASNEKFESLLEIIIQRCDQKFEGALVVGCGTGREAFRMSQRLNCNVEGIDITDYHFEQPPDNRVRLRKMDICKTDFQTGEFDLLYSFHVLEHISELDTALSEMRRLLRPGGIFCIGTPNKSRLLSSIVGHAPLKHKLQYNLNEWMMRLTNRWENALGAHAGFTRSELQEICDRTFGESTDITYEYYRRIYRSRPAMIENIIRLGLSDITFPGVYVLGRRTQD